MIWICKHCGDDRHDNCNGGPWCDCQHKEKAKPQPQTLTVQAIESSEVFGEL